jgi:hypothetical protein
VQRDAGLGFVLDAALPAVDGPDGGWLIRASTSLCDLAMAPQPVMIGPS